MTDVANKKPSVRNNALLRFLRRFSRGGGSGVCARISKRFRLGILALGGRQGARSGWLPQPRKVLRV